MGGQFHCAKHTDAKLSFSISVNTVNFVKLDFRVQCKKCNNDLFYEFFGICYISVAIADIEIISMNQSKKHIDMTQFYVAYDRLTTPFSPKIKQTLTILHFYKKKGSLPYLRQ